MRVAALYDIHGNLPALEAVITDVGAVDLVVIGGDVVWGPMPGETMARLRSLEVPTSWIMGNADRDVFDRCDGDWKAVNDWCADRLSDDELEFLRTRPATISIDGVLYCHGSPRSDLDPMTVATPDEQISRWCDGVAEDVVVCGHTHAQFVRRTGGRTIVNAGSVGEPFESGGAYYAVLTDGEPGLRCATYDIDATRAAILATGYAYGPVMVANIAADRTAEDAGAWFSRPKGRS